MQVIGFGQRRNAATSVVVLASFVIPVVFLDTTPFESAVPKTNARAPTVSFVTEYANMINNNEYNLAPEDVSTTSDGGYITLALIRMNSGTFFVTFTTLYFSAISS